MRRVRPWTDRIVAHRLTRRHPFEPPWRVQPWSTDGIATGCGAAPVLSARCRGPDQPLDRDPLRVERLRGATRSGAGRRPRDGERRAVALPAHRDGRLLRDAPAVALVHAAAAHPGHGRAVGGRFRACRLRPIGRGTLCRLRRSLRLCRRRRLFRRDDRCEHRRAGEAQHRHEHQHVGGRHGRHRLVTRPCHSDGPRRGRRRPSA